MDSKTIRYKNTRQLVHSVGGVSAFAERLSKQQSQVSAFAGEKPVKGIGPKIARQIESAFGKPNGWLDIPHQDLWEGLTNIAEPPSTYGNTRTAPVISWVQAGEWTEAIDIYQPGYGDSYESVSDQSSPNVFWLKVVGDSMTAPSGLSIPEGHLILVDPDKDPINGNLVVAKLEESQEVTFKKLVIDAGQKYLKPLNPNYKTLPINGNCRIVGVVTEAKVKL
ncbi:XRE family transcriptional regulator [Alcanivorax sp. S6407]|uniref:LexA family protein n=1 Tax=Alcanivorax sp. S6407 TaxID=2926424 RepID=UPI001FF114C7|nr:S24 family peptidase [Alcanivorax sp. S6407]MCK0153881.1 XRE family transcriptional regulator [Alcanivorax sp. S6407]